jgi:hypothetical protein
VREKKKPARLASGVLFLLAKPGFYSHLASWQVVTVNLGYRTSDIGTLAYRDTPKHVPAKVVLCYPRLLIRTLAYKDTKMLVIAVSLYPRFTVFALLCFDKPLDL